MRTCSRPIAAALVAALAVTGAACARSTSTAVSAAEARLAGAPSLGVLADSALAYAQAQLRRSAESLDPKNGYPTSTTPDGAWRQSRATDWRSGFFAGELWYMYELTHDAYWRTQAERWTAGIEVADTMTTTHDLGFMIFDSFGHEYALTQDPHAKDVILTAAAHLAGRFNPKVGATKSWDIHAARGPRSTWRFPVIVDNLMNLPLLFWAGSHGGDSAWRRMAERHALTSLHAHLRPDGTTAHVALFDPETGALERTVTAQGYSDSSVWSRGQAWAIYGFTTAYQQTHRQELLRGAERAADWFIAHLPPDYVPYWDFRDPAIPNAPRDASAAAIAASGLLELANETSSAAAARYRTAAEHILTSLATSYLSRGTPNAAILLHSTGAKPAHSEVDVGMIYADYYFIEALLRWRAMQTNAYLGDWPAAASPAVIGKRVAGNFLARPLEWQVNPRRKYVIYPEVATWYGALTVADLLHDDSLRDALVRKYDTLRTPAGEAHISRQAHVDYHIFGAVPLEIYMLTRDTSLLSFGRSFADRQWADTTPDGLTREARYWVDDMYMLPLVELQAYRATGDRVYLDRTARIMSAYLDSLQQPSGLFYHGPGTPFYWGRGNGWIAAGMAELLRSMPADHPRRARILSGYRKMMAALLRYQAPEGLWRQLIDKPESWIETSGSGMFAFAMVTGVKEGWLDAPTYGPAARKAWLGLVNALEPNGDIRDVCVGTNKASQEVGPDLQKQYEFYLARGRHTGDLHGEAPVLWTAAALLRGTPMQSFTTNLAP